MLAKKIGEYGKMETKIVGVVSDEGAEIKHVSKFMCIYQDIHSM